MPQAHPVLAEVAGGHVAENDLVVALEFAERTRRAAFVHDLHVELGRAERRGERAVGLGIAADDEHAGIAADIHEAARLVVLRDRVAGDLDLDVVAVEAGVRERLGKGEQVLAGLELHLLLAEQLVVAEQAHGRGLRLVGVGEDLRLERLALLDVRGEAELLDRYVTAAGRAERHDVERDPERLGGNQRGHRVADVLVAVGKEDELLLARLGKCRRAEPDRTRDVGALAFDDGLDLLGFRDGRGGGFQRRVGAEDQEARLVGLLLVLGPGVRHFACLLLLGRRHGVRPVEHEEDVHALLRPFPLDAGDGADQ
jgi:hypothetical protein